MSSRELLRADRFKTAGLSTGNLIDAGSFLGDVLTSGHTSTSATPLSLLSGLPLLLEDLEGNIFEMIDF